MKPSLKIHTPNNEGFFTPGYGKQRSPVPLDHDPMEKAGGDISLLEAGYSASPEWTRWRRAHAWAAGRLRAGGIGRKATIAVLIILIWLSLWAKQQPVSCVSVTHVNSN